MQISIAGLIVCLALLLVGFAVRAPVLAALFASFAFGSTAIATLPAVGNSSPLIYTVFAAVLLGAVALRRSFFRDLGTVFVVHRTSAVVLALLLYVCVGAALFPHLYQGETNVFLARVGGVDGVVEVPLMPSSSNLSQTAYFALGVLMFFGTATLLTLRGQFEAMEKAFVVWLWVHVALGVVTFVAGTIGAGDVLLPIRTARYALLTDVQHAGFSRVVGGFPEASSFGAATFSGLGFTLAYWRVRRSRSMLILTLALLLLLVLSTSSTAYLSAGVAAAILAGAMLYSLLAGRLARADLYMLGALLAGCVTVLAIYLYDSSIFDPIVRLIDTTLLNKADSSSARERSYWNAVSFQAFLDTDLLGAGMGSSRTSSWGIAILAQLGVPGVFFFTLLIWQLVRTPPRAAGDDRRILALHNGARASALCSLVAGAVSSPTADPGVQFFIALAVVLSCRYRLSATAASARSVPMLPDSARWAPAARAA